MSVQPNRFDAYGDIVGRLDTDTALINADQLTQHTQQADLQAQLNVVNATIAFNAGQLAQLDKFRAFLASLQPSASGNVDPNAQSAMFSSSSTSGTA